jgi:hypothetical protein
MTEASVHASPALGRVRDEIRERLREWTSG